MRFLVLLKLFCRNVGADHWRPLHTFLLKLSHARSPIYNSTTKIFRFKMWPRRVVLKSLQFHKLWIWYDVRANQQFALTLASSTLTKLTLIRLRQAQVKCDLQLLTDIIRRQMKTFSRDQRSETGFIGVLPWLTVLNTRDWITRRRQNSVLHFAKHKANSYVAHAVTQDFAALFHLLPCFVTSL